MLILKPRKYLWSQQHLTLQSHWMLLRTAVTLEFVESSAYYKIASRAYKLSIMRLQFENDPIQFRL